MNNLSLYLHVPFCKGKCHYCDFYSLVEPGLIRDFEKALCRDLALFSSKAEDYEVKTVYFGGGTPSLLSPLGVREIFAVLKKEYRLSPKAEITVEMNPESATEEVLSAFFESGANRISFGMQSAIDRELVLLGRRHRFSHVKEAVERARGIGFDNISLDLMYGLPDQNKENVLESLEKALSLSPSHLSFYLLTLSDGVPLYEKRNEIPCDEVLQEMYFAISRTLSEKGWEHYEISNASLSGLHSRHNSVYWDGGEYVGFGPGAHSLFQNKRFFVLDGVKEYVAAKDFETRLSEPEVRTDEDVFTEYVMLSLRQEKGLSLERLSKLTDEKTVEKMEKEFSRLEQHGFCKKTNDGYALTKEGFFVSNEIISKLIF